MVQLYDVQSIQDKQKLEDMKWALKRFCSERDYIMFLIGINTGLRVSNLLQLKVLDVKFKKSILIREGKTKKKIGRASCRERVEISVEEECVEEKRRNSES